MLDDIELNSIDPIKVPNLQDFRYLLRHSKLFQDYFNAFLNLPVRSRDSDIDKQSYSVICEYLTSYSYTKFGSVTIELIGLVTTGPKSPASRRKHAGFAGALS